MTLGDFTSNAHFVALAGLGALLAAGWRQVRSFFSYFYGFLVVKVMIDSNLNHALTRHLRKEWNLLPTGKFWIVSFKMQHQQLKMNVRIPFKLPDTKSTYYKGHHVLFVDAAPGSTSRITTFRWTDVTQILSDALAAEVEEDKNLQRVSNSSRFVVYDITGRDKSLQSEPLSHREPTNSETASQGVGAGAEPWVFTDLDHSFMYRREDYVETPQSYADGSMFLSDEAKDLVLETEKWFDQREWFQQRAIPWRRGLMLYGPGGTGKSTLAVILARRLRIPIYRFQLNTLSDTEYMDWINRVDSPALVLFEDFDRVFNGRESVKNKHLSFDTVINSMSGVKSSDGLVFVVTTNNIAAVDPAVGVVVEGSTMSSRPGRIDRILYMGALPEHQRNLMIERTLGDWPDLIERAKSETENFTIVQVQEYCVQLALKRID